MPSYLQLQASGVIRGYSGVTIGKIVAPTRREWPWRGDYNSVRPAATLYAGRKPLRQVPALHLRTRSARIRLSLGSHASALTDSHTFELSSSLYHPDRCGKTVEEIKLFLLLEEM